MENNPKLLMKYIEKENLGDLDYTDIHVAFKCTNYFLNSNIQLQIKNQSENQ